MEIQRVTRHLDPAMVEEAYRHGIFPMADTDLHIVTWHRPRRRAILPLDAFHVSRSLQRRLRRGGVGVTFDHEFDGAVGRCSPRKTTRIRHGIPPGYACIHPAARR